MLLLMLMIHHTNHYEENIIKRNLIILNLKPFYNSALKGDLTAFDAFYIQLQQEIKLNDKNGVPIVADCADNLFRNKHFDQCKMVTATSKSCF